MRGRVKENWGAIIGVLLTTVLGLALLAPRIRFIEKLRNVRFGEKLIHLSYDLPFLFRPVESPDQVVLVYMDDASHADLGQPYDDMWDRSLYAQLLNRLTAEHARAVSFDIVFSNPNPLHPEGDERFARAINVNGRVILGAD